MIPQLKTTVVVFRINMFQNYLLASSGDESVSILVGNGVPDTVYISSEEEGDEVVVPTEN